MTNTSAVITMNISGGFLVCGFLNGVIMINSTSSRDGVGKPVFTHSSPPFALTLSSSGYICAGGCDGKLVFANAFSQSKTVSRQNVDIGSDISCAVSSPSGNVIIASSLEKLMIFVLESQLWRQLNTVELCGANIITTLHWSADGTKFIAGTVHGALELFSCQWKRKLIGDRFEINYVGNKHIVIKDTTKETSAVYKSEYEIIDVKVIRERFVVVKTTNTLILGDMNNNETMTSEIDWSGMSTEGIRYCFDYENVVLINFIGELFLVELGENEILASVRTDFVNPHLMRYKIDSFK